MNIFYKSFVYECFCSNPQFRHAVKSNLWVCKTAIRLGGPLEITGLLLKYALRSVGGNIEKLAAPPMELVAPNLCLYKIDNIENSYDDNVPSDDSDYDSDIEVSSDDEEPEE